MNITSSITHLRAALIVALLCFPQLPNDQSYETGLEHLYNYEYEEAIAVFRQGIRDQPNAPHQYLRLAQSLLLRDKRDLDSIRFQRQQPGLFFVLHDNSGAQSNENQEWQQRYRIFLTLVQRGIRTAASHSDASYARYLHGALVMTDGAYLYEMFREQTASAQRTVEGRSILEPLLDDDDNPFHESALFYDALVRAQLGKNAPPGTAWILSGWTGLPVHLDNGMRDLRVVAEGQSHEATGAQLAFVDIMATLNNSRNNQRHAAAALHIAQRLMVRYPRNPSIRYHTILLYQKNGNAVAAETLRRKTLLLLSNDSRAEHLAEIIHKIRNAQ